MGLFRAVIVLAIYYFSFVFLHQMENKLEKKIPIPNFIRQNKYHYGFLMVFIFELLF